MHLVCWEGEHGTSRVDDYGFFERPLARPELFAFKTRAMTVEPHGGAWSLKFAPSGRETYTFGNRRVALRPGEMLLVGRGRTYGSEIGEATHSLSVFFPDEWVSETAAALDQDDRQMLDSVDAVSSPAIPAVATRMTDRGAARLDRLGACAAANDSGRAQELALSLLGEALGAGAALARLGSRLDTKRAATRDELLSRLKRAHDQICDQNGLGVDLDRLSHTACLSRFHFLRLFKQVYGETPLRFAARLRMDHALQLHTGGDVAGALQASGHRSHASFRRALAKRAPMSV